MSLGIVILFRLREIEAPKTCLHYVYTRNKKGFQIFSETLAVTVSGYQDSNLGPPAPKAGALTGLRYTPNLFLQIIADLCGERGIRTLGTV